MLYFRKIDETRWFGKQPLESLSVTELSTKDNELSVWMDYKKVFDLDLALAFILTQSCFKDIWCVKIPDEELSKRGIKLRQQDSGTCYERMRPYHTNIVVPTIWELGELASLIHDLVQNPQLNCRFYPESELKRHFYNTLKQDLITLDFNIGNQQNKWIVLREMQKKYGEINFEKLSNVVPLATKKK